MQTLRFLARSYVHALETSPIATKTITAGAISACGDLLCQMGAQPGPFDLVRTARMVTWAMALTPVTHAWYNALNKHLAAKPLAKVACDQLLLTPLSLSAFLLYCGALESGTLAGGILKVQTSFSKILLANLCVWVPVQYVNLGYVPPLYQVLFGNAVGLCWSAYLSFAVNKH